MTDFKDHFSSQARDYARFRPQYPETLFDFLADAAPDRSLAWDCATGNGQAAKSLAQRFQKVVATDASADQLAHAEPDARIRYRNASAKNSGLDARSVSLVTVAQALHWFELPRFYAEVARVLKPGGVIAAWCYALLTIDPAIDRLIGRFYKDVVGPYWPPERRIVESGYADLPFPFAPIDAPAFAMQTQWTLNDLLGYFGTWSATVRYREAAHTDPLPALREALASAWGDTAAAKTVGWPLSLRVGLLK